MRKRVPRVKKYSSSTNATAANVGYEADLWRMADALGGHMEGRTLVALRDMLLPKLISGEVRVTSLADAEKDMTANRREALRG